MVPQMWMAERRMRCVQLDASGNGQSPALVTAADTGSARNQAEPASRGMVGRASRFSVRVLCSQPRFRQNNTIISRLNAQVDAASGRTLTSWPSLQTDICNGGGTWVNKDVDR